MAVEIPDGSVPITLVIGLSEKGSELDVMQVEGLQSHAIDFGDGGYPNAWISNEMIPSIPARAVEISSEILKKYFPTVSMRGTAIEEGLTIFQRVGKKQLMILAGTIGGGWVGLEHESEKSGAPISLSRYAKAFRFWGEHYNRTGDVQKTIDGWDRYGKAKKAQRAFHYRMGKEVIHTTEMKQVYSIIRERLLGKDTEQQQILAKTVIAALTRDAKAATKAAEELFSLAPYEERMSKKLEAALEKVREMQSETSDDFAHRSSWSLDRFGADLNINWKKIMTTATVVAGGATIFVGSTDVVPTQKYAVTAPEPFPITAPAQEQITLRDSLTDEYEMTTKRADTAVSPLDLMVTLEEPLKEQSDIESVVKQMPAEAQAQIKVATDRLEKQLGVVDPKEALEVIQSVVIEIGQVIQADPKLIAWTIASVLGVSGLAYVAYKNPKLFVQLLGVFAISACGIMVGTGDIPTATAEASCEVLPVGSTFTKDTVIAEINNNWCDFSVQYEDKITKEIKTTHLKNLTDITPAQSEENFGTEVLATMEYTDENNVTWQYTVASGKMTTNEGMQIDVHFLIKFNPTTGVIETNYLGPDQVDGNVTRNPAAILNSDNFAVPAGFSLVRVRNGEDISFSLQKDGEDPIPLIPTPGSADVNFEISFKFTGGGDLQIVLTPTAEQPPTPEAPAAALDISKYTATPNGIEGFQEAPSVAYIFDTLIPELDRLNKLPNSPLRQFAEGVKPVVADPVPDAKGNVYKVNLVCNKDGSINCIPVAYIKIGEDKYVTILKIRNGDGTDGFFPWWNAGAWGPKRPERFNRIIDNVLKNPTVTRFIEIEIRMGGPNDDYPIIKQYIDDEEFEQAILKFVETQVFPKDYENIIPANTFQ